MILAWFNTLKDLQFLCRVVVFYIKAIVHEKPFRDWYRVPFKQAELLDSIGLFLRNYIDFINIWSIGSKVDSIWENEQRHYCQVLFPDYEAETFIVSHLAEIEILEGKDFKD